MPEEGYRTITIREEVYVKLSKLAEKTNRSIPKTIEYLLKNSKEVQMLSEAKGLLHELAVEFRDLLRKAKKEAKEAQVLPLVYDWRERRAIKKRGHRKVDAQPKGKQSVLEV